MLNWLFKFGSKNKAADESDFGRRHGWLIEKNGDKIGELDYLQWDAHSQFWHDYRVKWINPAEAPADSNAWTSMELVLRNRHYTDVVVQSFLAGSLKDGDVISIRGACVPKEKIQ